MREMGRHRSYGWSYLDQNPNKYKGGLRKIADAPIPCRHPEHNPPGMIVLSPGMYEHICPGCGNTITFTVSGMFL